MRISIQSTHTFQMPENVPSPLRLSPLLLAAGTDFIHLTTNKTSLTSLLTQPPAIFRDIIRVGGGGKSGVVGKKLPGLVEMKINESNGAVVRTTARIIEIE